MVLQDVSSVSAALVDRHRVQDELKSMLTAHSKAEKEMIQATRILRTVRLRLTQLSDENLSTEMKEHIRHWVKKIKPLSF